MTTETIQPGDLVQAKRIVPYDTDLITGVLDKSHLDFDETYLFLGCSVSAEGHPAYTVGVFHVQLLDREGNTLYVIPIHWDEALGYTDNIISIDELFTKVSTPCI